MSGKVSVSSDMNRSSVRFHFSRPMWLMPIKVADEYSGRRPSSASGRAALPAAFRAGQGRALWRCLALDRDFAVERQKARYAVSFYERELLV